MTAAAVGISQMTARSYSNIIGANDDIRIAVVGFNGRGKNHIDSYRALKGVRIVALCDADEAVLNREYSRLNRPTTQPTASAAEGDAPPPARQPAMAKYQDVRKLLDDKTLDAVSIATPNHWHSLIGIWACQAGKDVYVEKPVSHNVLEGRRLVEAARKYDRIVQAGTQWRASAQVFEAFEWIKGGNLGKVLVSRGLCYKRRASIGKTEGPQPVPETVDYDIWCGPAPKEPLRRKKLHYDWHWVWPTGCGDLGNQGIHQMDLARWALGKAHLSPKVLSVGGRVGYVDDGTTPNTMFVAHDYGDSMLIFEVRGLPDKAGTENMSKYRGSSIGNVVECENGYVSVMSETRVAAYDKDGAEIKRFTGAGVVRDKNHFANFLKVVRSRKREDQNAEIEEGHISSALCHTGNLSYRLGQQDNPQDIKDALKANKPMMETFDRMAEHLAANDVNISMEKLTLGAPLAMEPMSERFINNEKANAMLTRNYRKPYVVPDKV
jgi:predicted dehydrogenase